MNATCTEARKRAPTTTDSAAEESWQLLVRCESSETPCPKPSSRAATGNKPGRTSSEMGKVGNIVSAEREGRLFDSFLTPAIEIAGLKTTAETMGDYYAGNGPRSRLQMPQRAKIC